MKKILITGSAGFSGRHFKQYLQSFDDVEVTGIDINSSPERNEIQCDLLRLEEIERIMKKIRPDYIIHLAGINKCDDFRQYYYLNLFTTINLLEAVVINNLLNSRILVISSSAVYGLSSSLKVKENDPLNPITFYGNSKLAMESIVFQYIRNYNLRINVARPFNIIGTGQPKTLVVSAFLDRLSKIKSKKAPSVLKVGNLSAIRDFIDVRDVVRAYWKILNTDISGEIYNIGTSLPTRVETILSKLIRLIKVDVKIEYDRSKIQKHDVPRQVADTSKISKLGWKPQIELDESLEKLVMGSMQ